MMTAVSLVEKCILLRHTQKMVTIANEEIPTWCLNVSNGALSACRFMQLEKTERGNTKAARPSNIRNITAPYMPIESHTLTNKKQ